MMNVKPIFDYLRSLNIDLKGPKLRLPTDISKTLLDSISYRNYKSYEIVDDRGLRGALIDNRDRKFFNRMYFRTLRYVKGKEYTLYYL